MKATDTPATFVRVVPHKEFMALIKEARRVKYVVENLGDGGMALYRVTDDETGGTSSSRG